LAKLQKEKQEVRQMKE